MKLRVQNQNNSINLRTTGAVQSRTQKTFFFAGFESHTIDSCMLHKVTALRKEPEVNCDKTEPEDPNPPLIPPLVEPVKPCVDLHPEKAKLNFYLLQMNSVRVVFTKALAFNTILTIRAVLF
ncbi:uncharacterized protein LOC130178951 isoform X2 [Seriola aureovittata]|uniref:uncharacterized protein LOC130178951 isoform X2 n=1 Tax=Seriola aureovittata TaxID=2871759 RepID=UPI0024BEFD5B|nr:uncharacterized protein LOC130178951 isoform X2 [Seriola aureovittata]